MNSKDHDPKSALTSTQVQAKMYNLERGMEELGLAPTYPKGTLFPGGLPDLLFEPTDWKLELIDKEELSKLARGYERYEFLRTLDEDHYDELRARMVWSGYSFDEIVDKMKEEAEGLRLLEERT